MSEIVTRENYDPNRKVKYSDKVIPDHFLQL